MDQCLEPVELEISEKFEEAFKLLESSRKNIFITGKAGTGKSTLLNYFRNKSVKNVVVLAPTGVAAVNVRGQTIHSFFGFKPDISPWLAYRLVATGLLQRYQPRQISPYSREIGENSGNWGGSRRFNDMGSVRFGDTQGCLAL